MSEIASEPASPPAAPSLTAAERDDFHTGRKLAFDPNDPAQGMRQDHAEYPTWRGWALGLCATIFIAAVIPYVDFVLTRGGEGSMYSFNAFPMLSVVMALLLLGGAAFCNHGLGRRLHFTRQDLTMAFCMTMVTYTIAGVGFWSFWSSGVTASRHFATEENRFNQLVNPHLTPGFFVEDPPGNADPAIPRPVEWFYTGLPPGGEIPWAAWTGPFLRWSVVVLCMYGIWFAISALLSRRWSEHERLPFPMAQVPAEMFGDYDASGAVRKSFFSYRAAQWGIAFTFLLQSWNSLAYYHPSMPSIPLINWGWGGRPYFSEPPWKFIGDFHYHIFPTIIGLTFLLSVDVAFSLWFFYFVHKVLRIGLGETYGGEAIERACSSQGTGALFALVLMSFWMARSELGHSIKLAITGRRDASVAEDELSPRATLVLLLASFLGAVVWLSVAGVGAGWAMAIVMLFMLVVTGLTRLIAEAGVFAAQFFDFPIKLLSFSATPALMGTQNYVMLSVWDRMFALDWFRIVPMPAILHALHLSSTTGLRRKTAMSGMALAVVLALGVGFFSFLGTVYTQGGANSWGWFMRDWPPDEVKTHATVVSQIESYKERRAKAQAQGEELKRSEIPQAAQTDWKNLSWMGVGSLIMTAFMLLRRFIFWWPHPAGYVMWMCFPPFDRLWLSFFLGWACKFGITKYGGLRAYNLSRRFFIGMVIGEAVASVVWTLVALYIGQKGYYPVRMS